MFTFLSLISCLMVLGLGKENLIKVKPKSNDLNVVESQEHNFLESPSNYKRYQQNNNGYEDGGSDPEPYMFNFDFQDNDNNKQFRKEESNGNAVKGSYGYVDANGLYRNVEYTADSDGFRAKIRTNEPGMDAYHQDKSTFPADVQLEVSETPRNLQYASSDQIPNLNNRHYSGGENSNSNSNYRSYSKGKTHQYNEPDQYAASNNYDSQQFFGRSVSNDIGNNKVQTKNSNNPSNNYINWNSQGKNFEYQSAFSDGVPVYVDSKSSKAIISSSTNKNLNTFTGNSNENLTNENNQDNDLNISPDQSGSSNRFAFLNRNQKSTNRTMEKKDIIHQSSKKLTNLQLEKPLDQFKFVQQFKPFNEIREKFMKENPKKFTRFVNNMARV